MASVTGESLSTSAANDTKPRQSADRYSLSTADFKYAPCALPRPTEAVVWYSDCTPREGCLLGHDSAGAPVVRNHLGHTQTLHSFDQLRLKFPHDRLRPNWHGLTSPSYIVRPHPHEADVFRALLNTRMPPGPKYSELLEEIHYRGYDIFLVGGTVRDILAGIKPHDVDVVTSMPLQRAVPLLASMYRLDPKIAAETGFVRIGGTPKSGDPFIDLKSMVHSNLGCADVVFSSSLVDDMQHRDFACNSIYYDAINNALIDPAGYGISGAGAKVLELVSKPDRPPYQLAQICIRYFKFVLRGFVASDHTVETIRHKYLPCLPAMRQSGLVSYIKSQLLSKEAPCDHERILDDLRFAMREFGARESWDALVAPIVNDLLERGN